jgi:hypothetical protein
MIIRKYKPEDAPVVDEIYERCHKGTFGRPNLSHVLSAAVIEDEGKVIGFGCIEIIAEAVMILDTDRSVQDRAEMLDQLLNVAKFIARERTFERFYMFPSDEKFIDILVNHFDMTKCSPILSCELPVIGTEENNNGQ